MPKRNSVRTKIGYVLAGLFLLALIATIYLVAVAVEHPPKLSDKSSLALQPGKHSGTFYTLDNNWFRKSRSGLYELYVEGAPFERGVINGKLTRDLVVRQEVYFNEQINKMIPSKFYLHFLKYFIGWFNRNLADNVPEEYKEEIYGVSESASNEFAYVGSKYQRILNYHAAHDIGHALQNMALVGCTSFGTWNARSQDSTMIIGRNFDFYVGDKFAEDKIVAFINPSSGYKFMSVTWGGFIGVVSGMNEKGLAVTINAAKSGIPAGSATPVSLVAREILQYAKNISEAVEIARKRKMFVSESFLLSSAADKKAVVVEKTPEELSVYDPKKDFILCTNHFQSEGLGRSKPNLEQINESASAYRYERLQELVARNPGNTVQKTVDILRDRQGLGGANIGMGNEKAINQLIAHHSIVFQPEKLLVWVSTSPWQLGEFVAYDLNKVFARKGMKQDQEVCEQYLNIARDTFVTSKAYDDFTRFRQFAKQISNGDEIDVNELIASNPDFYHTYVLAGDYLFKRGDRQQAAAFYQRALTREIATKKEENYIKEQIKKCAG